MLLAQSEDGGAEYHVIRHDEEEWNLAESYCGETFLKSRDAFEEATPETVRERRLCGICAEHLHAREAALRDPWAVATGKALEDGEVVLEEWNRFFGKTGGITFHADEDTFEEFLEIVPTYRNLVENQKGILAAMLAEFLPVYEKWRGMGFLEEEFMDELMPPVTDAAGFATLLEPRSIIVSSVDRNNVRYIGYEFGTPWDEEHGLGVMMWGAHVAAFGEGDTALDDYSAEDDKEKSGF